MSRLGAEQQSVDGKPLPMWTGRWSSLIQREVGRRIWWNLVSLDWLMAPSYGYTTRFVHHAFSLKRRADRQHPSRSEWVAQTEIETLTLIAYSQDGPPSQRRRRRHHRRSAATSQTIARPDQHFVPAGEIKVCGDHTQADLAGQQQHSSPLFVHVSGEQSIIQS